MSIKRNIDGLPEDIIRAVYRNDLPFITNWIKSENLNNVDKNGRSVLSYAILARSIECISLILKLNPNINIKDKEGWSPLHYAAQNYQIDVVNLLVDSGADIEVKDKYGNTPLWRAVFASQGKGELIGILLAKGADANNENYSGISPVQLANTIANYNVKQYFQRL